MIHQQRDICVKMNSF